MKKIRPLTRRNIAIASAVTCLLVAAGVMLVATQAGGAFVGVEVEQGSLSGPAQLISDASASGGKAIMFTASAPKTLHFAGNLAGGQTALLALGFTVMDISGSQSNPQGPKATIDALPSGAKALVWVGNLGNAPIGSSCPAPGFSLAQFQAQVNALASDNKVFGYFISDEPHPSVCPSAASDIAARADYIHAHAPGQKAFIVILDGTNACSGTYGCEFNALKPANTHVDLIGVDPYPCHYDAQGVAVPCDVSGITTRVNAATSNGVPVSAIVPVFQTFGQEGRSDGKTVYYRTPSTTELNSMLATWKNLVPNPVLDYSYSWGVQCSPTSCPSSQALSNHPELQTVMKTHNQ